jgi:hypothetical protein
VPGTPASDRKTVPGTRSSFKTLPEVIITPEPPGKYKIVFWTVNLDAAQAFPPQVQAPENFHDLHGINAVAYTADEQWVLSSRNVRNQTFAAREVTADWWDRATTAQVSAALQGPLRPQRAIMESTADKPRYYLYLSGQGAAGLAKLTASRQSGIDEFRVALKLVVGSDAPAIPGTSATRPAATQPTVSKAQIDGLVKQLGSEDYAEREAAQKDLVAIGLPARRALEQAAKDGDAESATRAKAALKLIHENEQSGGLRIESSPGDDAKPGLCAVGVNKAPSTADLYDRAVTGRANRGAYELIGRLPGDYTPIRVMEFTRKGHELAILVALAPARAEGANYLRGELPRDLPAGRYHVQLTAAEYEEIDGELVPAPKTDIRAFYQLECYFVVGGTPEEDAAWKAEGQAVDKTFQQLAARLKFLETDVPKFRPDDKPQLFLDKRETVLGEVTGAFIQFSEGWDGSRPRKVPKPGTFGASVYVNAFRYDPYPPPPDEKPLAGAPVVWDGKSEFRRYSVDKKEFGWQLSMTVEGNLPEIIKKVNGVIDEELSQLSARLARPIPAAGTQPAQGPTTRPAAAASPAAAWANVLAAMQSGDKDLLIQATTARGLKSLAVEGWPRAREEMRSCGLAWTRWEFRLISQTETTARANLGPQVKEHGLEFVKTEAGWKLDLWTPGE